MPKSSKCKQGRIGGPNFGYFMINKLNAKVTKVPHASPNTDGIFILSADFFFLFAHARSHTESLIFHVTRLLILRPVFIKKNLRF